MRTKTQFFKTSAIAFYWATFAVKQDAMKSGTGVGNHDTSIGYSRGLSNIFACDYFVGIAPGAFHHFRQICRFKVSEKIICKRGKGKFEGFLSLLFTLLFVPR